MKIVLVEDNEMLCKSLSFFLTSKAYQVTRFENGQDAADYISNVENQIDMVITDLNLPFCSGKEVVMATRRQYNQKIKIIVITSLGQESSEMELFDLGADDFLSKPFSPNILLKRIEKLLTNETAK